MLSFQSFEKYLAKNLLPILAEGKGTEGIHHIRQLNLQQGKFCGVNVFSEMEHLNILN